MSGQFINTPEAQHQDNSWKLATNTCFLSQTVTQVLEGSRRLSCLQRIQKGDMKEIAEKDTCITKLQADTELLQQEGGRRRRSGGPWQVMNELQWWKKYSDTLWN